MARAIIRAKTLKQAKRHAKTLNRTRESKIKISTGKCVGTQGLGMASKNQGIKRYAFRSTKASTY